MYDSVFLLLVHYGNFKNRWIMIAEKFKKLYAMSGGAICMFYIIFIIVSTIIGAGIEWEQNAEGIYSNVGWELSPKVYVLVIINSILALSIIYPWLEYFNDMCCNQKFRIGLFKAEGVKGALLNIIYMIHNICLIYMFTDLCMMLEMSVDAIVHSDLMFYIIWFIFDYVLYLVTTVIFYRNNHSDSSIFQCNDINLQNTQQMIKKYKQIPVYIPTKNYNEL